jgi:hypothetical protein
VSRIERPSLQAGVKVGTAAEAKGLEQKIGELAGTHFRDALSVRSLAKEAGTSGVLNVPFEALFQSQAYRRGELKANEYAAATIVNSVGFSAWTVGGALGFGAGMVSQSLFDRLIGHKLAARVADAIPEAQAKPIADAFSKYVANPLHDKVWKPASSFVMNHKVLTAGVLGLVALRFPGVSLGLLRSGGVMAGGLAAGLAVDKFVLDKVFGPSEEPFGAHGASSDVTRAAADGVQPAWVDSFNRTRADFEAQGLSPDAATEAVRQHFTQLLVTNGATPEGARELVAAIAAQADAPPSPAASAIASRPLVG